MKRTGNRDAGQPPKSGIEARRQAALNEGGQAYKDRRHEIIQAAANVFRERGFDQATLNEIAERVGTDRASLYYYVGNKEELLQEIVRTVINENLAAAERIAAQDGSAGEKVQALIEDMIRSFDRNYPHIYVYLEDMARISRQNTEWARDVLRVSRRFESILVKLLEQGQADGSFRSDIPADLSGLTLFGMINWTHRWYRPGTKHSPKQIARAITQIFFHGYGPQDGPA